jgi:two-component system sensor histidine kinase DesK
VSALESLHRYTRLTLLSTTPLVGGIPLLFAIGDDAAVLPLIVVTVCAAPLFVLHWRRIEQAVVDPAEVRPVRSSVVPLLLATAVMGYAFAATGNPGSVMWAFVPSMFIAELQYGRTSAQGWRIGVLCAAGVGAAAAAVIWVTAADRPQDLLTLAVSAAIVSLGMPFAELLALRQWRLALELDQARQDAAELGATRERLRFAEDLHDILGHALEVVSLKSELAARLGQVDPDRAHAEMIEVQRLARGALQDVRELGQGRRSTDLATELAGARGLLASAGIECAVDVEPAAAAHSELLGRVLREAVTNLLRHADTRHCWITVRATTLSVVNDGVGTGSTATSTGTGLAGLARRVAAEDGVFTAGPGERPGTFSVEAVLR